ncbi:MAG TPA: oligopeptide transporter, OPT family [Archangium sp.]|uniref:OPT family oligopeptide transporter n=1 Tax=Archangium sp. TaxID=1872627 RepID=UPI002E35FCD8|nr:oligopeptide transporter, OPT family [Archangium sp.]HEX5747174.1 oligopeptide transporter, OPT family [Archangium sp.]
MSGSPASGSPAPSHEPTPAAPVAVPVADSSLAPVELTRRAVVAGVVFGAMFGAANAYLGLRVGMTVATSIPVAVMTVALFRALGGRASIQEANLAQTIGSASTALATGSIFTLPALFLWGLVPSYWQIAGLALLGGLLGISAMIPLRRLLLVRSAKELPYPEGRACAEVLHATTGERASTSAGTWIFRGLLLGAGVKLVLELLRLVPGEVGLALPGLRNAELAMEIAPALIAVGYILGFRQSAIVVSGSVISSLVLIPLITHVGGALTVPLAPEATKLVSQMDAGTIWSRYVRYIGAGAVAAAGIATVVKALPSMAGAFLAVASGWRGSRGESADEAGGRTERDIPGRVVGVVLVGVVGALVVVPGLLGGELSLVQRVVCAVGVGVLGVAFVAVASRIVGLVGVSSQPTSGITLVTLLCIGGVFTLLGWTGPGMKAAVLMVGTVVAIAASKAGDISQDLKTGQLVGATPAVQQVGQYIGAATACWAVAATLLFLGKAYGFGSQELPAPQATLMKTIIEGLMSGSLPKDLVLAGAGLSVGAMLAGVNGLGFAIGVYLPLAAMAPIFVGGVARRLADGWSRKTEEDAEGGPGVLAASGLVAGEGLAGLAVAVLVGGFGYARPKLPLLEAGAGSLAALALVVGLCAFLVRAGRSRP